jgi:Raf kinase inhibitor-like YbhB/YbcL family protein
VSGSGGSNGGAAGGNKGNGGTSGGTGGGAGGAGSLTLTSMVLKEGDMFPADITCAGNNTSPDLTWTAGPSSTMSYALTLTDLTNGYVHWAIWNIPGTVTSLAASLATTAMLNTPMGARQTNTFGGSGYSGPCPGTNGLHMYQFQVYAIPTATLAGSTTNTTNARDSMRKVSLATGTLSGKSDAKMKM